MAEEKKGFFKRLVSGLTKTRDNIVPDLIPISPMMRISSSSS